MLGLGTDIVDLDRFRVALERTPRIGPRLFTEGERARAEKRRDPVPTLAARFAAKEAVMKVLGVGLGGVAFHDIEVGAEPSGRPVLELTGRAAERAAVAGMTSWQVSLSHSHLVAIAVVIAH